MACEHEEEAAPHFQMIYAMVMKFNKTSLRCIIKIHLRAVRWKRVCNRLRSKHFKTNKVLSWNVSGDLIFAKCMERSKDSCSTDTSAHGLQAGFWRLLFTKHILSTESYPWMAAPPCRLPYLDFWSHQLYCSLLCTVCTSSRAELVTPNLLLFLCCNRVKASGSTPNFDI